MATREERAWAAGFFDGEGHTQSFSPGLDKRTGRNRPQRYIHLTVGQIEREILERFRRAVGGAGYIYGPYHRTDKRGYKKSDRWEWKATNREHVTQALEAIWPWLGITKRLQARAALDACTSVDRITSARFPRNMKRGPEHRRSIAEQIEMEA